MDYGLTNPGFLFTLYSSKGDLMIYWYKCLSCGKVFSWVFAYDNDPRHCTGCHCANVIRITLSMKDKELKE